MISSKRLQWVWVTTLAIIFTLGSDLRAAEKPNTTTISVERMCEGCSKKIVAQLKMTPGVEAASVNVKMKTVMITPVDQTVLSPRLLWEVVEKKGERPIKLEGPSGTFKAKPDK